MSVRIQRVSPFYRTSQFAGSEEIDFRVWVFPGLCDAEEGSTTGVLSLHRETKFIIGFDFAVTLSPPDCSCVFFWHHFRTLFWTGMANVFEHKRWFHSSRVQIPLASMSASWFLVSMNLIWILESKLIRTNNESRATLWVLQTCLIVGLLPFMIILITASLSSNTYNKASWWEDWTFEGTKSTLSKSLITLWDCLRRWIVWGGEQASRLFTTGLPVLSWFWVVFPRIETIRSHRSRAGIPSNLNPASKEMISDSVNCAKLKFVSYTSNLLEQMYDFRKRTMFHPK